MSAAICFALVFFNTSLITSWACCMAKRCCGRNGETQSHRCCADFWRALSTPPLANSPSFSSSRMNIHEYQAKALFEKYGVPVPKGAAATTPEEFVNALAQLPEGPTMVKSQIHAGGRGKGTFTDGFKGGVKFCPTKAEAKEKAGKMLNNTLVTAQTGAAGRKVQTIYFTQASDIKKEFYLAVLLDRVSSRPVIVASTEGGVEIEKVAHDTPEKIHKIVIDPAYGLADFQVHDLVTQLGLAGAEAKNGAKLIR